MPVFSHIDVDIEVDIDVDIDVDNGVDIDIDIDVDTAINIAMFLSCKCSQTQMTENSQDLNSRAGCLLCGCSATHRATLACASLYDLMIFIRCCVLVMLSC